MRLFRRKPKRKLDEVEQAILALVAAYQSLYNKPLPGRKRLAALLAALKFLDNPGLKINARFYIRGFNLDSPQLRKAVFYLQEYGLLREHSEPCNKEVEDCDDVGSLNIYAIDKRATRLVPKELLEAAKRVVANYGHLKPKDVVREIMARYGVPEHQWIGAHMPLEEIILAYGGEGREG